LTLTEAEVFLCEESKNKRKKENKPEAIFYNLLSKKKYKLHYSKTKQTTNMVCRGDLEPARQTTLI
jgi:hypothetical protein